MAIEIANCAIIINMGIKRLILVIAIIILFAICFTHMNVNFDRLSRYPYENEEARNLIDEYLNDEEIEYIIEYSIAPYDFINYIKEPSFNIYHIDTYRDIKGIAWYLGDSDVVSFSEEVLKLNAKEEALKLLEHYYYNEVIFWLKNHDVFSDSAKIVENPNAIDAYLDDNYTVSIRSPYLLVDIDTFKSIDDKTVTIRDVMVEPLNNMREDLINEFSAWEIANLYISKSYISYDEQVSLYKNELSSIMPGHSEHQLGLAIDLTLRRGNLLESDIYAWLIDNAYKYGFIINSQNDKYDNVDNVHLRFVGYELADTIYHNGSSLKKELGK